MLTYINESDLNIVLNDEFNQLYIEIITNEKYVKDNFNSYINFNNIVSLSVDDIIFVVNNNYINENIDYNDTTINLMKTTYYINDNLERYINNNDLPIANIITNVNSIIDYDFYTNVINSDISKGYLILVNKYNKLDESYIPNNLVTIESKYGV